MENQNVTETVPAAPITPVVIDVSGLPTIEKLEQQYVGLVLEKTGGNKVEAAKILGVSVKTIYNKLAAYEKPVVQP